MQTAKRVIKSIRINPALWKELKVLAAKREEDMPGLIASLVKMAKARVKPTVSILDQKCPGCDESLHGGRVIQASDGVWVHYMTGCYTDYENKLKASQSAKPRV